MQNENEIDDNGLPADEELTGPLYSAVEQIGARPVPAEAVDRVVQRILSITESTRLLRRRVARRLFAIGVVATAVLVAVMVFASRPTLAWAQVVKKVRDMPWIKMTTKLPGGKTVEVWSSPKQGITAWRGSERVEYHDYRRDVFTSYVAGEKTIYRLPQTLIPRKPTDSPVYRILQSIFRNGEKLETPIPGTEIVRQSQRTFKDGDRSFIEYDLTVRRLEAPMLERRLIFQVDPETRLPRSMQVTYKRGGKEQTLHSSIDYPKLGPADIYALGVPKTAKVVDRVPKGDIARMLAGLKAGRQRFDNYRGIFVRTFNDTGFRIEAPYASRVWRKGRKWRVEQVLRAKPGVPQPPDDVDLREWWQVNHENFVYYLVWICDGETVYHYRLKHPEIKHDGVQEVLLHREFPVFGPPSDPSPRSPHWMPEFQSHPHIGRPSKQREFNLKKDPTGPSDTKLLVVRETGVKAHKLPELYRLWIDPSRNYVAMRLETAVFDNGRIAFIDTHVVEELDKSPRGKWYPTRIRRETSKSEGKQFLHYYLDFDVKIDDVEFFPLQVP